VEEVGDGGGNNKCEREKHRVWDEGLASGDMLNEKLNE
jgi:hypothetical protein